MNLSIMLGVIFVLLAAIEIGAAYYYKASSRRAGSGLVIGAVVSLCLGALFLIQHARFGFGLLVIVVAQIVVIVSLVMMTRQQLTGSGPSRQGPTSGQAGPPANPPGTYGTRR